MKNWWRDWQGWVVVGATFREDPISGGGGGGGGGRGATGGQESLGGEFL